MEKFKEGSSEECAGSSRAVLPILEAIVKRNLVEPTKARPELSQIIQESFEELAVAQEIDCNSSSGFVSSLLNSIVQRKMENVESAPSVDSYVMPMTLIVHWTVTYLVQIL